MSFVVCVCVFFKLISITVFEQPALKERVCLQTRSIPLFLVRIIKDVALTFCTAALVLHQHRKPDCFKALMLQWCCSASLKTSRDAFLLRLGAWCCHLVVEPSAAHWLTHGLHKSKASCCASVSHFPTLLFHFHHLYFIVYLFCLAPRIPTAPSLSSS